MKTVTFIASPRKKGNSSIIADRYEQALRERMDKNLEITNIWIHDLDISPCTGCGYCDKKAECIIDDDMQKMYPLIQKSDLINFITPIYFGSLTAQLKTFIDRFQPFYNAKFVLDQPKIPQDNQKQATLIAVSGMKKERFFQNAQEIMKIFCINANLSLTNSLYLGGLDDQGDILEEPEKLNQVSELAQLLEL